MSFAKGNVSFRMFYVPADLPEDLLPRFQKAQAAPLSTMGNESLVGWVGGRHLLDIPITEENSSFGGYTRLTLMKAERRVPVQLLKAKCAQEEQIWMAANGKPFVDRKNRSEIRKQVMDRLLPEMAPTLSGIQFVYDPRSRLLFLDATSENKVDAFRIGFLNATGLDIIPVCAETIASKRHRVSARDWPKVSFSPEVADQEVEDAPGADFLTWLLYATETSGGIFKDEVNGEYSVGLEGPLLLVRQANGAHETALRKGLPTVSAEVNTALLAGKKLERSKMMLGRNNEVWSFSLNAANFSFSGVKLPDPKEMLDPASMFQNRMGNLIALSEMMFGLYDVFTAKRKDPAAWSELAADMRRWVAERRGRS